MSCPQPEPDPFPYWFTFMIIAGFLLMLASCVTPKEAVLSDEVCAVRTDRGLFWLTPGEMGVDSCDQLEPFYNSRGVDPSRAV